MMTYLDELKEYFEKTPKEQVLQEFSKYDVEENNVGSTVDEFLQSCQHYYGINYCPPDNLHFQIQNKELSSKFSSGFFYACM